ncbi:MAG: hypothetical protein QXJ12_01450 [Candidatus Parvarchaeota archaeon]|nr:hypothetical protein [Candidatus Parvarchaeota archaeon]
MAELFCKKAITEIMPAARAAIAEKMYEEDIEQQVISKRLGITQPAVSQYVNGVRGRTAKNMLKDKRMSSFLDSLIKKLEDENYNINLDTCKVCEEARKTKVVDVPRGKEFLCLIEMIKKNYGKYP